VVSARSASMKRTLIWAMAIGAVLAGSAGAQGARTAAAASWPLAVLPVDGAHIAYRDINPTAKGTPLLLIVGYGSTMAEWDPTLVARLAQSRRLIMFDNRGMGNSTGSVQGLTVQTMANDAAGLIRALKLGRTDVLGWSMGGFIAQQLALQDPRLVRRLILASTDPGSPHTNPGAPAVIQTLTDPATTPRALLPILFPADQQPAAQTWLTAIGSQPGLTAQDFTAPAATLAAQKLATTTFWLGPGDGTYARLSRLAAPTLVAYGADDVIVPPSNAQILLGRIPHASALRVADAGHAFLFQDPATIAATFSAFLQRGSVTRR